TDRTRYGLMPRDGGPPLASVSSWYMDLLGATWRVSAAGLVDLSVPLGLKRPKGLGIYLVSEALRALQVAGVMLVEAQVDTRFTGVKNLFEKLGFVEIDQAVLYRKAAPLR